jgi:hypothetical protein
MTISKELLDELLSGAQKASAFAWDARDVRCGNCGGEACPCVNG